MSQRYMPLDAAIAFIEDHKLFLHYDSERELDIWTVGKKVPITLRRSLVKHRQELLRMMSEGDKRVCPSPLLHKSYTRNGTCTACQQLEEVRLVKSA